MSRHEKQCSINSIATTALFSLTRFLDDSHLNLFSLSHFFLLTLSSRGGYEKMEKSKTRNMGQFNINFILSFAYLPFFNIFFPLLLLFSMTGDDMKRWCIACQIAKA